MKRFFLLAVMALVCTVLPAQNQNKKDVAEVTFMTDMDCPNCVKKVQDVLPFEKGVKDLKITLEKKTIWIRYRPSKTNEESLAKAINKCGFAAEAIKPKTDVSGKDKPKQ